MIAVERAREHEGGERLELADQRDLVVGESARAVGDPGRVEVVPLAQRDRRPEPHPQRQVVGGTLGREPRQHHVLVDTLAPLEPPAQDQRAVAHQLEERARAPGLLAPHRRARRVLGRHSLAASPDRERRVQHRVEEKGASRRPGERHADVQQRRAVGVEQAGQPVPRHRRIEQRARYPRAGRAGVPVASAQATARGLSVVVRRFGSGRVVTLPRSTRWTSAPRWAGISRRSHGSSSIALLMSR